MFLGNVILSATLLLPNGNQIKRPIPMLYPFQVTNPNSKFVDSAIRISQYDNRNFDVLFSIKFEFAGENVGDDPKYVKLCNVFSSSVFIRIEYEAKLTFVNIVI